MQGGKRRGGIAEGSCESLEVEGVLLQTEVTESSINVLQYLQLTTAVQINQQLSYLAKFQVRSLTVLMH